MSLLFVTACNHKVCLSVSDVYNVHTLVDEPASQRKTFILYGKRSEILVFNMELFCSLCLWKKFFIQMFDDESKPQRQTNTVLCMDLNLLMWNKCWLIIHACNFPYIFSVLFYASHLYICILQICTFLVFLY